MKERRVTARLRHKGKDKRLLMVSAVFLKGYKSERKIAQFKPFHHLRRSHHTVAVIDAG